MKSPRQLWESQMKLKTHEVSNVSHFVACLPSNINKINGSRLTRLASKITIETNNKQTNQKWNITSLKTDNYRQSCVLIKSKSTVCATLSKIEQKSSFSQVKIMTEGQLARVRLDRSVLNCEVATQEYWFLCHFKMCIQNNIIHSSLQSRKYNA